MQLYIGTKSVQATPMSRLEYNLLRGWTLPADENGEDEGYLVEYLDGGKPNLPGYAGYISWSPKEQFENAYHDMNNLSFGDAIYFAKQGKKVARTGWNGKNMYIVYINPYLNDSFTVIEKPGMHGSLLPYLAMKTADNKFVPWLASQTDMLANDWVFIAE